MLFKYIIYINKLIQNNIYLYYYYLINELPKIEIGYNFIDLKH